MPIFTYRAFNENGNTITGEIEADSQNAASHQLAGRGYIPQEVYPKDGAGTSSSLDRINSLFAHVKAPELILFTKQFRTMVKAGISMLNLLQVLESQTENPALRKVTARITQDIKEGATLQEAFKKHPRIFSPLYCSILQAGEASGSLPEVLERLIYIIGHEHKVKSDLKAALTYPIFVSIALVIAFFVLLTTVIPKFIKIFLSAGIDIPLPTRICMGMYTFLEHYWHFLLAGVVGGVVALFFYLRTEQGKFVRDTLFMKIPILGPLIVKTAMSRFASIFAILQSSGIPVLDSIRILSGAIGNAAIGRVFEKLREQLQEGRGISQPLKTAKYFPPMVINMIAIGEEFGSLDEMLTEIAAHYDAEVEYAMGRLSDAIGPILTIGLSAVVGFFALAIFLPMWDLTQVVK